MHDSIENFIDKAKHLQNDTDIQALCEREIAVLYDLYTIATVHKMVSRYRNALRTAGVSPLFLVHMHERKEASDALRAHAHHTVAIRNRTQYPLTDPQMLIDRAVALLDASSYSSVLLGLALLTGRRPFELAVTASFVPDITQTHYVWFAGQAKTREEDRGIDAYRIPVLIESYLVCAALDRLRSFHDFTVFAPGTPTSDGKNASQLFDDMTGKTLRGMCQRVFGPLLPGYPMSTKALRKIYACLAYDRFAPGGISVNAYLADILGHSPDDLATAQSYQDFYLAVPAHQANC